MKLSTDKTVRKVAAVCGHLFCFNGTINKHRLSGAERARQSPPIDGHDLLGVVSFCLLAGLLLADNDPAVDGQRIQDEVEPFAVVVGEQAADLSPVSLAALAGILDGVGDEGGLFGLRHGSGLSLVVRATSFAARWHP